MEELDLKELISIFMKRKLLIILVVIIFALIGAIYTIKFITPTYQSYTTLVLVQTGSESNLSGSSSSITTSDMTLNSKLADSYIEIATSEDKVLSKVIDNLNLDMTIDQLKSIITVSQKTDTAILKITVDHTDPELSCRIANEIAKTFVEAVENIYKLNNLSVLDSAKVPERPYNVHLAKNIVIFAFVGGILVSGYILLINMLDTTVKSDVDIENALQVPVLASIVLASENSMKKNITPNTLSAETTYNFDSYDPYSNSKTSLFENYSNDNEYENYDSQNYSENFESDVEENKKGNKRKNRRK